MDVKKARENAYLDIMKKYKYAKIETEVQNGEIVLVKVIENIRLDVEYLKKNGYLK